MHVDPVRKWEPLRAQAAILSSFVRRFRAQKIYLLTASPSIENERFLVRPLVTFSRDSSHEAIAVVGLVHAPVRARFNFRLETETAFRQFHIKKEEGKGEERKSVAESPPDAPRLSLDNAVWIPSDDDDEAGSDNNGKGFPSLKKIMTPQRTHSTDHSRQFR